MNPAIPQPRFIADQMLLEVLNVTDRSTETMEDEEVQVIFEGVRRPRSSRNKSTGSPFKELKRLALLNDKLTNEKDSLLKELEVLKREAAQLKSQNILAQRERSNQVLDVLNNELTCVICSNIVIEAVAIQCGHIFCSYCIETWFSTRAPNSPTCPTCRAVNYRDPVKISNVSRAITSIHTFVSKAAQSDRRQLLEDRTAQVQKVQEASAASPQWTPDWDVTAQIRARTEMTMEIDSQDGRLSPVIMAFEGSSSVGEDQPTYVEAQGPGDLPDSLRSTYNQIIDLFNDNFAQ